MECASNEFNTLGIVRFRINRSRKSAAVIKSKKPIVFSTEKHNVNKTKLLTTAHSKGKEAPSMQR